MSSATLKNKIKKAYTFHDELNCGLYDKFGRVRYYSVNIDNIRSPFISHQICADGYHPTYPDGKEFAILFSHDIDLLAKNRVFSQHQRIKRIYKGSGMRIPAIEDVLYKRILIEENNPARFLETNKKYGISSTFYFLALEQNQQDYNYSTKFIAPIVQDVLASGSEVGLHGSHEAYNNSSQIATEKARLASVANYPIKGYRNHYLRFTLIDTWKYLQENDFEYDSTYGFPDVIGFRNGMAHPFLPYDATTGTFLDVLEIPLIIMDTTLFEYMRLGQDTALQACKQLIDEVRKTKGAVSVLWHNHYLAHGWLSFYEELIKYCVETNAWMPTSGELNSWWREKGYHKQQIELIKQYLS